MPHCKAAVLVGHTDEKLFPCHGRQESSSDPHREAARETQRRAEESKIQLVNDPALKAAIGKELVARQEGFVETILELCQRSEPEYLATADLGPNSPTILLRPSRTFGRRLFAESPKTVKAARPYRVRSRSGSAPTPSDQSTSAVLGPVVATGLHRGNARRCATHVAAVGGAGPLARPSG